ncbi:hypothetical protein I2494_09740 [Budviciaceae bacterium BWR-B9]|uniref:Uncharacterized protein n=1 Tax=Limnobaculum allomyrinae TaxID=2791986 RepID=A0ABS1IRR3_9GAMM|nr:MULTISPECIES: hypothetical protein [Limnobaculum]MBK5143995.1 hypothetical protein [Limnobaculum allomyrinae]MBV7691654.1 hypothetical protein [Limnobaculum sp. M2-1]
MQIVKHDNYFEVEPNLPEFRDALSAITSRRNVDQLVTYALRRHGYGDDGWVVAYPEDEVEQKENNTFNNLIEVCCVGCGDEMGSFLTEGDYIKLLSLVCESEGMNARAQLLNAFLENPTIIDNLLEANAVRCNKRWKQFAPFLQKYGWRISDNKVEYLTTKSYFNIDFCTSDLDVLYREARREIEMNQNARKAWIMYQESIVKALEDYFKYENK